MSRLPELDPSDRRLNPGRYNTQTPACICVAFTELRPEPATGAHIDTMLVYGEPVRVFETHMGWSRVQALQDSYVGWVESKTLMLEPSPPTHMVCVPRTFLYPSADLKLPHRGMRSMGSLLRIEGKAETRGTRYLITEAGDGVIEHHVRPMGEKDEDYVSVAETLLRTPYLWAGTTAFGIDCSGLVKLAMLMAGKHVLRDSDQQAATIGEIIDPAEEYADLCRGDLIFWRGHVGIVQGPGAAGGQQRLLHANGRTMDVASEPLKQAVERIAYLYEQPIGIRRP